MRPGVWRLDQPDRSGGSALARILPEIVMVIAFMLAIVFQYFTIAPMRDLSLGKGIIQAIKADTLSMSAW